MLFFLFFYLIDLLDALYANQHFAQPLGFVGTFQAKILAQVLL